MIKLGDHTGLAVVLRLKRGDNSKTWAAKQIGISVNTYTKLEDFGKAYNYTGNTSYHSQHLARYWVNTGKGFYRD